MLVETLLGALTPGRRKKKRVKSEEHVNMQARKRIAKQTLKRTTNTNRTIQAIVCQIVSS